MFLWSPLLVLALTSVSPSKIPLFGMPTSTDNSTNSTEDSIQAPSRSDAQTYVLESGPAEHLKYLTQAVELLALPSDTRVMFPEIHPLVPPPIFNKDKMMGLNTVKPKRNETPEHAQVLLKVHPNLLWQAIVKNYTTNITITKDKPSWSFDQEMGKYDFLRKPKVELPEFNTSDVNNQSMNEPEFKFELPPKDLDKYEIPPMPELEPFPVLKLDKSKLEIVNHDVPQIPKFVPVKYELPLMSFPEVQPLELQSLPDSKWADIKLPETDVTLPVEMEAKLPLPYKFNLPTFPELKFPEIRLVEISPHLQLPQFESIKFTWPEVTLPSKQLYFHVNVPMLHTSNSLYTGLYPQEYELPSDHHHIHPQNLEISSGKRIYLVSQGSSQNQLHDNMEK